MIEARLPVPRQPSVRILRDFGSDRSGASAIEFSIVVFPFVACILMVFQFALYYFGVQTLENATARASRGIMTGSLSTSSHSLENFRKSEICPHLVMALDCEKIVVNAYKVTASSDPSAGTGIYRFIDSTSKVLLRPPIQSSFCVGGPGDYVFLDVSYELPGFLGSLLPSTGGVASKGFVLRSTSFFRSEMYLGEGHAC